MTQSPTQSGPKSPQAHLRILETTDLHVHIMPYDYFADTPGTGLAHTATLIHSARAEATNCVLFDNGDFLQGSLMSDWAANQPWDLPHPMIAAMNTLDYDAATLGNHEFNYGLGLLENTLAQARFPFVCANISRTSGDPLAPPWRILKRTLTATDGTTHAINIGVIGFAPPQTGLWDRYTQGAEIQAHDIVTTAQTQVPLLRAAGADIVVALCHSGIGDAHHTPGMENAAVPLAAVDGIDVLLTGHTHRLFPALGEAHLGAIDGLNGALHGKPTVMAGFHGSHLGQIDLTLHKTPSGWTTGAHSAAALPANAAAPDTTILTQTEYAHDQTLRLIRTPLATISNHLHSHFATVAPANTLTLLAEAMRGAAHDALQDTAYADLPLVCGVAPYNSGGWNRPNTYIDAAPGPVAIRHAADLYPYPNDMCLMQLTGANIRLWLERAAHAFHTVTPGKHDQPLLDHSFPSYDFDVLHGLSYQINISQPPGARITALTLADGTPFGPKETAIVATNGYRAAGGGGYDMAGAATPIPHATRPLRDILIDHLRDGHHITPIAAAVWSFAPLNDTTAWFESGVGGLEHLDHPHHQHIASHRAGRNDLHRYICSFA